MIRSNRPAVPLLIALIAGVLTVSVIDAQRGGAPGAGGRGGPGRGPERPKVRKTVLAWADTRNGIAQHDSTSHALAVIERLGYESGAYDTYIRTDSNIVAQAPAPDADPNDRGFARPCWRGLTRGTVSRSTTPRRTRLR